MDLIMKVTTLLNRPVIATLLISASLTAFASGGGGPRGAGPYPSSGTLSVQLASANAAPLAAADAAPVSVANTSTGKTRAQVRSELLQAEEAGLLPTPRNDYPPSAETIARNRARFQQIEHVWKQDGQLTASDQ
jgi:Domain of unknown function (DUF4148)